MILLLKFDFLTLRIYKRCQSFYGGRKRVDPSRYSHTQEKLLRAQDKGTLHFEIPGLRNIRRQAQRVFESPLYQVHVPVILPGIL